MQQYGALPLLGSRLNARNTPGPNPYCNVQKLFPDQMKLQKFNTTKMFYVIIIYNVKISRCMAHVQYMHHSTLAADSQLTQSILKNRVKWVGLGVTS